MGQPEPNFPNVILQDVYNDFVELQLQTPMAMDGGDFPIFPKNIRDHLSKDEDKDLEEEEQSLVIESSFVLVPPSQNPTDHHHPFLLPTKSNNNVNLESSQIRTIDNTNLELVWNSLESSFSSPEESPSSPPNNNNDSLSPNSLWNSTNESFSSPESPWRSPPSIHLNLNDFNSPQTPEELSQIIFLSSTQAINLKDDTTTPTTSKVKSITQTLPKRVNPRPTTLNLNSNINLNCTLCSKTFASKKNLKRHSMIHQVERTSWPCIICGKAYANKYKKKLHEYSHFSLQELNSLKLPYNQCAQCDKIFFEKTPYSRHLLSHAGLRTHPCPFCPKGYFENNRLQRHLLAAHQIQTHQILAHQIDP